MATAVGRTWVIPKRGDGSLWMADIVPVLSNPGSTNISSTGATVFASVSRSGGSLYYVITFNPVAPTATQIKAGLNDLGASAIKASNVVVSSTGQKQFVVSGLSGLGNFYTYFVHTVNSVDSAVVGAVSFTLLSSAPSWLSLPTFNINRLGVFPYYINGIRANYLIDPNNTVTSVTLEDIDPVLASIMTYEAAPLDRIKIASAPASNIVDTVKMRAHVATSVASGNFSERAALPGTMWAHPFNETAELENFVRWRAVSDITSTNPDPLLSPNPLTIVTDPDLVGTKAVRSRAIGTIITQDIPSVAKGTSQVIHVQHAEYFPAPATVGGAYSCYIGTNDPSGNWNYACFEEVKVTAVDTGANTLTITRTTEGLSFKMNGINYVPSDPCPFIPASNGYYRIGFTNSGSWNRPFCCFPAVQNGKVATPDVGITNLSAAKVRTWNATRYGPGHTRFREGYWGHRWYWDTAVNPSAPYKNWTPNYTGDGQNFARPDAYEGDEWYLQFRVKMSAKRLSAASPQAKLFFIQACEKSGSGQLFMYVGPKHYNEQPLPAEAVAGKSNGMFLIALAGGADARQPAGGYFGSNKQTNGFDFGATPWQQDYPLGTYANRNASNCYTFCYQADVWATILIHFKAGRDNADIYAPTGRTSAGFPTPYLSASDANYRSQLEVKVHQAGMSDYHTLCNITGTDFATWFFGDGLGDLGSYQQNAPGHNAFWGTLEFNMYFGSGSVVPPDGISEGLMAEPIFSRNLIPFPV